PARQTPAPAAPPPDFELHIELPVEAGEPAPSPMFERPELTCARRSTMRRYRPRSRFERRARKLRWPLRLAIPVVWSIALMGGAYAAQHILRQPPEVQGVDRTACDRVQE